MFDGEFACGHEFFTGRSAGVLQSDVLPEFRTPLNLVNLGAVSALE